MEGVRLKTVTIWVMTLIAVFQFPRISVAHAIDLQSQIGAQLGGAATKAEVGTAVDPRVAVASMIQVLLTVIGTVFFVLMIVSGYWLVTARGNEEKEEKAKDTIKRAVIGLIIVLMSYAITILVSSRLIVATKPAPPPTQGGWWSQNISN